MRRFIPSPLLRLLTAAGVAAVLASTAAAQEKVEIKALCFPKQAAGQNIELLVGEGKVLEIGLQSHEFTVPVKVPRLAAWKFGKSSTGEEGKFTFTTYAQVKPLSGAKQLLLFIRRGTKNEDGFQIIPLSGGDFGGKDYMVMNLSTEEVAGIVGGSKFKLPPGRHTFVKPKADRGEGLCFASLLYQRKDKWRSFFSSNWRLREKSRALVFVYNSPGGKGSPRLHSVIDPL